MKRSPYKPPTPEQAKRHWAMQQPSVFRKPKQKDRGITIVTQNSQLTHIIEAEITGELQAVYRLKSPVGVWDDPVARMMDLIRLQTQKGMGQEDHRAFCQTPDDLMIHEALYGEMSSSQRANVLTKISKQLFEKQQEVLKQSNLDRQREDKKEASMIKARLALKKRAEKGTIE